MTPRTTSSPGDTHDSPPSRAPAPWWRPGSARPQVEIVVPAHDEEAALSVRVRRLRRFLTGRVPFTWRIVIADNASTDATPEVAAALARELPSMSWMRLERAGRGRALRAAWSASDAQVVRYMDVDLSTDLRGPLPLVAPLLSGGPRRRLVLRHGAAMGIVEACAELIDRHAKRIETPSAIHLTQRRQARAQSRGTGGAQPPRPAPDGRPDSMR